MATKKNRKKQTKLKKTAARRKPIKKTAKKQLTAKKKAAPRKKLAKKKAAPKAKQKLAVKKPAVKTRAVGKKTTGAKTAGASRKRVQGKGQSANIESFATEEVRARSAGQSGSLQGLSNTASADSESVDELIEEGNAFEAEVVSGVEAADRGDEEEVHTHEVPEDDVPGEYLDKE
jgi:hypothetical protein